MTNETTVDPLQLVPHRVKVFKLIYESAGRARRGTTAADDQTTGEVTTGRESLDELTTRHTDELKRTKHINSAELR